MAKSKEPAASRNKSRSARKGAAGSKKNVDSARQGGKARKAGPANGRGTKQAQFIALLERNTGATLDELVAATGWLPHTTRAALTGLRHRGFVLDKSKRQDGTTVYRISSAQEQRKAG